QSANNFAVELRVDDGPLARNGARMASFRTSFSSVLRPSSRSSSRIRPFSTFTSDSGTTDSSAPRTDIVPSSTSRRHLNTWLGDTPKRRLTDDTLCPGTRVSSTILRLSSAEYLRRRPGRGGSITSTSGIGPGSILAPIVSWLGGPVLQG